MIGRYGLSLIGTSHAAQIDGECQDAHAILELPEGWVIAAIADGVGSASHSATGSRIAADAAVQTIEAGCPTAWDVHTLSGLIKSAFHEAWRRVLEGAEREGIPSNEYDTTLTVVIYNGRDVVYGHVGDGGVVALKSTGDLVRITEAQKGEEYNTVVPLRAGPDFWVFRALSEPLCGLLMMTDGVLDVACPWILARTEQPVFVGYVRPFIDANVMKARSHAEFKRLEEEIAEFLSGERSSLITDDKTVVGLINTDALPEIKDPEYYKDPDWVALRRAHDQQLYGMSASSVLMTVASDEGRSEPVIARAVSAYSPDAPANECAAIDSPPQGRTCLATRIRRLVRKWRRSRRHVDEGGGQ